MATIGQTLSTDAYPTGGTVGAALSTAAWPGGGTWGAASTINEFTGGGTDPDIAAAVALGKSTYYPAFAGVPPCPNTYLPFTDHYVATGLTYAPTTIWPSTAAAMFYLKYGPVDSRWATWMYQSVEYVRLNLVNPDGRSGAGGSIYEPGGGLGSEGISTMESIRTAALCRYALRNVLSVGDKANWDAFISAATDYMASVKMDGITGGGFYTNGNINIGAAGAFWLANLATGRALDLTRYQTAWDFSMAPTGGTWAARGYGRRELIPSTFPDGRDGRAFMAEYGNLEMLQNTGFENTVGTDYAFAIGGVTIAQETGFFHAGGKSLKATYSGTSGEHVLLTKQQSGAVVETVNQYRAVPNTVYTFEVWTKCPVAMSGTLTLKAVEWDDNDNITAQTTFTVSTGIHDWTKQTFVWTSNVATTQVTIHLGNGTVSGIIYYDDVTLKGLGLDPGYCQLQGDFMAQLWVMSRNIVHLKLLNEITNTIVWRTSSDVLLDRRGGTRQPSDVIGPATTTSCLGVAVQGGGRSDLTATWSNQWNYYPNGLANIWLGRNIPVTAAANGIHRDVGMHFGSWAMA